MAPHIIDQATGRGFIEARTEGLAKMWDKASEHDRTMLGEMHMHYEGEVARMVAEGGEPHNIAHTIHTLVDASVAETMAGPHGRKVRCREGCAACCRLHVNITAAEASLLLGYIEDVGVPVDWHEVARQAPLNFHEWQGQTAKQRRCVFLYAERCMVYEHRPNACRKYMVTTDPAKCDTVRHPGQQVGLVAALEAEVVVSASLATLKAGSLPRMLLEAKQQQRKEATDGR